MKTHFVLFLCVVALAEIGCQTATDPKTGNGISGQLYEIGAPAVSGDWTPPPLRSVRTVAIYDSTGVTVGKIVADSLGRFEAFLPAARYKLRIVDLFPQPLNGPYVVPRGNVIFVKVYHDNGMR